MKTTTWHCLIGSAHIHTRTHTHTQTHTHTHTHPHTPCNGRALDRVTKEKHRPNRQKLSKKCPKIVFSAPLEIFLGYFFDIFRTFVGVPIFWAVQRFAHYSTHRIRVLTMPLLSDILDSLDLFGAEAGGVRGASTIPNNWDT